MANSSTLADNVFQIACVVPDLHAAIRFFKEKLGVPTFLVREDIQLQEQTYLGKPGDYRQSLAFGFAGQMQIELIQPLAGTSSYSEFLKSNPKGGVQHLGIMVENYDAAVADMKARGFTLVQSGRNGDTRFAYFDTDDLTGTLMEVVYLAPPERAGFEKMKRKEA
jgi:catechol 2,3-dioxygenase-like lactoylglutathione lyase family enzyme